MRQPTPFRSFHLPGLLLSAGLLLPAAARAQAGGPGSGARAARPDSLTRGGGAAGLPSQLVLRLDYATRALFAGRDFGVRQSITTPSLFYNHSSGAYAGVSGSFYSASSPAYALTDFALGYGNLLGNHLLYNVSYDHYYFSQNEAAPLANTLGGLLSYDLGSLSLGTSYSYLFGGGETGHRLVPSLSAYKAWRRVGFLDKIYIMPNVSATLGTENVSYQVFPQRQIAAATGKPAKAKKGAAAPVNENTAAFGLMSWNLALPVKVRLRHLTLGATYNYVIPIQLPHESVLAGFDNKSFFNFSVSYGIDTGQRAK